jgi:hypothetical protein
MLFSVPISPIASATVRLPRTWPQPV